MKRIKPMLPFLAVILMVFYLLPLLIHDTGTAMMMLLLIIPLICFLCSVIYGWKHSFDILYSFIVTALFIPTIFIFYNSSALIYVAVYGAVALVGNLLGMLLGKKRK
ncbi:MAG: hypothetical protein GXY01_01555 [Clostridiales bacterium]|jgi:hypothetical protein|nr:hypothetical protein [Clostridiales bacterium]